MLTNDQKQQIATLSQAKLSQSEIASRLDISRTSVRAVQREMGLATKLSWPEELKEQVRNLALEGWTTVDIAHEVGVSSDSVRKLRRELGVMPTTKVRVKRWHVTAAEKDEIRRLTLAGVRQSVIARKLQITAATVSKVQLSLGLPTQLPTPEKEIMELFRSGVGGFEISRRLHCPVNRVWAVMHKHDFKRADKLGIATPPENIARFVEALKNREGYIKTLAKKYGVGFCKARATAHEVLGTYRFLPGASKPPLSSVFPQRHFEGESRT